ncbi:MAG: glutathione S-transferase [Microvirgula sp.]
MQLIGMLDSPYVRRTAISLRLMGVPFEHRPLSVFGDFDRFREINPVVKAPTLICDDGTVLMDSSLIIDYAGMVSRRSLMPAGASERVRALRLVGLALVACEKTVQIVYEQNLRPAGKQHQPWLDRVGSQLVAAWSAIEQEAAATPLSADAARMTQADLTVAVAWAFRQLMLPDRLDPGACPLLADFSLRAERLPAFLASPQR